MRLYILLESEETRTHVHAEQEKQIVPLCVYTREEYTFTLITRQTSKLSDRGEQTNE